MTISYHPGKANVVASALSKLYMGSSAHIEEEKKKVNQRCANLHSWECVYWTLIKWNSGDEWGRVYLFDSNKVE